MFYRRYVKGVDVKVKGLIVKGYELKEGEVIDLEYGEGEGKYIEVYKGEDCIRYFEKGKWYVSKEVIIKVKMFREEGERLEKDKYVEKLGGMIRELVKEDEYIIRGVE